MLKTFPNIAPTHKLARNRLSRFWAPAVETTERIFHENSHGQTATLLIRAGYVRSTYSGIFQLLPLGYRVQHKIEMLLDEHMNRLGASKVSLSTFSSEKLWERSGRLSGDTTELFRLEDRRGMRFLLSPTHEEEITSLVGSFAASYRDLPLRLYQVSRKYRDEKRARAGLLRGREFLMKDLYTFDATREEALETYKSVGTAYSAFFSDLKVPIRVAKADSGNIGGELSHEYHIVSALGEDDIMTCPLCSFTSNTELLSDSQHLSGCPQCHGESPLISNKAIELGHAFLLGTRYSVPFNAYITTATNAVVPMQMGCFGIGVSRMIAGVADILRDAKGLNWPRRIAPFEVVVVPSKLELLGDAHDIYDLIAGTPSPAASTGYMDPILDDRGRSLPWKLKDADLIGYPVILIIGRAWEDNQEIEVQCRRLSIKTTVSLDGLRPLIESLLEAL